MSDIFILEDNKKSNIWNSALKQQAPLMDRINAFLLENQSLTVKEKVIFFRLLSTMINAWITLTKWISILEKQEKEGTVLKVILKKFWVSLKEWKWLSECIAMYPKSFSPAEVGMIESWEKTWKLNTSLKDLADQVEKNASINGKLKSALM